MASATKPDPVRATFVAILQQLNRIESVHEGRERDQALSLDDLERSLGRFWAVDEDPSKLPVALGLLVRNGLVQARAAAGAGPVARRASYRITAEGKRFLVEALQRTDRIA